MLSFTANTRETWAKFSEIIGAEHIYEDEASWTYNRDKVVYRHKGSIITLDFYATDELSQTRIYTSFNAKENFRFVIYSSNFFERLAKLVGMQDVNIGDKSFDERFIIKTSHEEKVRLFLSDQKIRELILGVVPNGHFATSFQADWNKGEIEKQSGVKYLSVIEPGVINDVERLELIFQLIIESLKQLTSMGIISAEHSEDAPPRGTWRL